MKMITAIVRTTSVESVVDSLQAIGIVGISMFDIKGTGEHVRMSSLYTVHSMMQFFVPDERVEEVTNVILQRSHTGLAGDGLIAVHPVEYLIKTRTKEKLH